MDQVKIGKLIARLRKNKNLTQQALGDIMGVGHQAVSKWERGNCLPDISIINKLCEVLDITSDELLRISGTSVLSSSLSCSIASDTMSNILLRYSR